MNRMHPYIRAHLHIGTAVIQWTSAPYMDLSFNPVIKGHRHTKDWTCAVSGVRNEDGGVLRERESQRGERISAAEKAWGECSKMERWIREIKMWKGVKERRENGGGGFSLGKAAAALTCPPPPPESLPQPPSHWGLIKGLQAIIHSLSNHLSDMQFHQHCSLGSVLLLHREYLRPQTRNIDANRTKKTN